MTQRGLATGRCEAEEIRVRRLSLRALEQRSN